MKHDIDGLEKKLRNLNRCLADLGSQNVSEELLQVIHKPGWTTPAEFALVSAMADSLQSQIQTASMHFKQMIGAASQVGQQ
jgi:hypothetical protein